MSSLSSGSPFLEELLRRHDAAAKSKKVNRLISHLPGVRGAVAEKGKAIQARADALFAEHDRPGGHKIVGQRAGIDYLVSIEGPVPHIIEFGRSGYVDSHGNHIGPMEGLHILGRAVDE